MKNPFANLFKKKKKDEVDKQPTPTGDKPKKEGFFDFVKIVEKKFKDKNFLRSLSKDTRSNSDIC